MASKSLSKWSLVLSAVVLWQTVHCAESPFPDGFLFGVATAAYQIEGAWNVSDKGENVWDWWTHNKPWLTKNHENGDVACDSYHKYKEDVQIASDIGVDFYRLSLSWSRILPTGFSDVVSKDGVRYYNDLFDELLAKGIQPMVTLYHWDHPEHLERMGGWTNELMVDWFADYARVVFEEFGSKIKFYNTINEPAVVCLEGYGGETKAPGKNLDKFGAYACMHNVLKAHAKVYHMYKDEFEAKRKAKLGMVFPCSGFYPKYPDDTTATEVYFQFQCGWMTHPIFSKTGDYPQIMKERIAENSKLAGYPRSILPEFSEEWIEYIRGTADFLALNHYTSQLVETVPKSDGSPWYDYSGVKTSVDPSWPSTASSWLKIVPEGFGVIIRKLCSEYGNPPMYITENGMSDLGDMQDYRRISYFQQYLKVLLSTIKDGCNVKGYTIWSLLDNFEWQRGYSERFGLVRVDFSSPNRTRTPKTSMKWVKELMRTRTLNIEDDSPTVINIV